MHAWKGCASVFWVGLGGQVVGNWSLRASCQVLKRGWSRWYVQELENVLRPRRSPGEAQLGNPAALFILVGVFSLAAACMACRQHACSDVTSRRPLSRPRSGLTNDQFQFFAGEEVVLNFRRMEG